MKKIKNFLISLKYGKYRKLFQPFFLAYHYFISIPRLYLASIKFSLIKHKIPTYNFYSNDYIFNKIINDKISITRFGDGEILWMEKKNNGNFGQLNSNELSERLIVVSKSLSNEILICIPDFFSEKSITKFELRRKISRNYHLASKYKVWMKFFDSNRTYGDSLITRPYLGIKDSKVSNIFESWKLIWKNKSIIIVEGDKTRFGIGNDLLNSSLSVKRIIVPAQNAFAKYNDILSTCKKYFSGDSIFLLAVGPTATVLAYDLSGLGQQAIDIGHLDIEYEWFLNKSNSKTKIKGKYVNEVKGIDNYTLSKKDEELYNSQILEFIN